MELNKYILVTKEMVIVLSSGVNFVKLIDKSNHDMISTLLGKQNKTNKVEEVIPWLLNIAISSC